MPEPPPQEGRPAAAAMRGARRPDAMRDDAPAIALTFATSIANSLNDFNEVGFNTHSRPLSGARPLRRRGTPTWSADDTEAKGTDDTDNPHASTEAAQDAVAAAGPARRTGKGPSGSSTSGRAHPASAGDLETAGGRWEPDEAKEGDPGTTGSNGSGAGDCDADSDEDDAKDPDDVTCTPAPPPTEALAPVTGTPPTPCCSRTGSPAGDSRGHPQGRTPSRRMETWTWRGAAPLTWKPPSAASPGSRHPLRRAGPRRRPPGRRKRPSQV